MTAEGVSVARVVTVVGNRPQFVKAAAVSRPLRERVAEILVNSGQHYDRGLSEVFFEELALPRPDLELEIGSGSHAAQTAATMAGLEPILSDDPPAAVLVYGDTNTTLGAALVAAKLQIPLAHVEAGMRSFDRSMPEERNRVVVDHLADLLLAPTEAAMANLAAEGLADRAVLCGDPMADLAAELGPIAEHRSDALRRLGLSPGSYLLATLHRVANVDEPVRLAAAVALLLEAAADHGPLVFPVHPRARAALETGGLLPELEAAPSILLCEPLGYLDFCCLLRQARAVLTDSGGVQKEAYMAATRCLTLRTSTEWVETVESGWNSLAAADDRGARQRLEELLARELDAPDPGVYGDGAAAKACAEAVAALSAGGS